MSTSLKVITALPTIYAQRAGFRAKRLLTASIKGDLFEPTLKSYNERFETLVNALCDDLRRLIDQNPDAVKQPAAKPVLKPRTGRKEVMYLDEEDGEFEDEDEDDAEDEPSVEELNLIQKLQKLHTQKKQRAAAEPIPIPERKKKANVVSNV
jgi:hypothetical protein